MYQEHAVPLPAGVTLFTSVSPGPAAQALLLQGEHDMTFPVSLAGQAASRIPRATAVVLADAGHLAHVDDPHGWLSALRRFLAR